MANLVVLGTQWGDEGKGKIVDVLTPSFDVIIRYQGGHNAGHTVYIGGKKIVLHLIPSGILHPHKLCILGNGVALNPRAFLDELASLRSLGVEVDDNIVISRQAHLILPYHSLLERWFEARRGQKQIGTTCRGIGPSYEDKAARIGIRAGDLLDLDVLRAKIEENVAWKNEILRLASLPELEPKPIFEEYAAYADEIAKYIQDVSLLLARLMREKKCLLFEGAQGTLLDVDHGTYPYVTSSNSTAGGACTGCGVGPTHINGVLGVTKAYITRVGGGPMPTEIQGAEGRLFQERGDEFGATTGRPRRCGWFDAVAVAYACRINGIDRIALTKPDVLDVFDEIKICVGYRYRGERLKYFPTEPWILERVEPEYRSLKGWKKELRGIRDYSGLPAAFIDYLHFIEDLVEARVAIISTGMERGETILIEERLQDLVNLGVLKAGLV
jgi:adenylosuccinate synthase